MAEALGISERLLKNWVRDRVVPFIKIGRCVLFDPTKVEAALARFEDSRERLRETLPPAPTARPRSARLPSEATAGVQPEARDPSGENLKRKRIPK